MRVSALCLVAAAAAAVAGPASATQHPDTTRLGEIVVSASRTTQTAKVRGASAELLTSRELGSRGITRLEQALRLVAGTEASLTGPPGGVTSVFLRGVNSSQTLLLVDGIRVSDASLPPGALLGGFELAPSDRVEVVLGPQSTLYGGAAVGGVIAVGHEAGVPVPWRAGFEAGSFGQIGGRLSGATSTGRFAVSGSGSLTESDNERPHNRHEQRAQVLRATYSASSHFSLGASFRGLQQTLSSPGDIRTTNTTPVGVTRFEHYLSTLFGTLALTDTWTSRVTVGWQDYFLRGSSRFDGGPEFVSTLASTRWIADWQHQLRPTRAIAVAAGVNAEWIGVNEGDGRREERLRAASAEISITPRPELGITAGLRNDSYSTFGSAVTGRVTIGYFVASLSSKLRATLGTGFLPPSLAARYGGTFQRPNPALRPERSTGWDTGVDLFVAGGRGVVGVTVFGNHLRDLIGFQAAPYPDLGQSINIARARTWGLELAGRVAGDRLDARAGYTFLQTRDLGAPEPGLRRLIRRPTHSLAADVSWAARPWIDIGAGIHAALDREDTDFNTFPAVRVDPGDYVDARVRAVARLGRSMRLRISVDNLAGNRYEEVYGFPALGRRATVGLEVGR